jgi:hypothetical protein
MLGIVPTAQLQGSIPQRPSHGQDQSHFDTIEEYENEGSFEISHGATAQEIYWGSRYYL